MNKKPITIAQEMADSVMYRYKPEQVQWHYEHGLVLQAIYAVGVAVHQKKYYEYVKKMYDTKITADGIIETYKKDEFNLDQINPGKMLFALYAETKDEKYRKAIEVLREQLRKHPRTKSGGFWHKKIYPEQMWLDGLYMQAPFYAQYAAVFEKGEVAQKSFDDITAQLILIEEKARDSKTGLLYHAWDESKEQQWANKQTGCSPHFWGRALGWYCMALVDVLDFLPQNHKNRAKLIEIITRLAPAIEKVQDKKSGLWYQVLALPNEEGNYLETSASSMFVYFFAKALKKGYFANQNALFLENAQKCAETAYSGLVETRLGSTVRDEHFTEYHLKGICSVAGLGGNPYRDGSFKYYIQEAVVADDFKGVGPFILASLEMQK